MVADLLGRLGARVRELRTARELTQEVLAEAAGISLNYLSIVERGRKAATLDTLARIAKALDVSLSELFLGADRAVPPEAKRLGTLLAGRPSDVQRRMLRILSELFQLETESPARGGSRRSR